MDPPFAGAGADGPIDGPDHPIRQAGPDGPSAQSSGPAGLPEDWPAGLRTAAAVLRAAPGPAVVCWGPDLLCFYNDAYARRLGPALHPRLLGRPLREAGAATPGLDEGGLRRVMAGEATAEGGLAPIHDPSAPGGIGGVLALLPQDGEDQRLRSLLQAGAPVTFRMGPDWADLLQLSGGGLLADTVAPRRDWLQRYVPPEDHPLVLDTLRKAVPEGRPVSLEHRVWRAEGGLAWVQMRAVPVAGADGTILEWIGAASDVTARREAEEALRLVSDNVPALIAYHDRQERYVLVNAEYARVFGVPPEAILGRTIREWLGADAYARLRPAIRTVLGGRPVRFEDEAPDGQEPGRATWTEVHYIPRRDRYGNVEGFVSLTLDVSHRKQDERRRAEQEARQAYRLRLNDALRGLDEPDAVCATACRLLGEQLDAGCVHYAEIGADGRTVRIRDGYLREGLPSIGRRYDIEVLPGSLLTELRAGRRVVCADRRAAPDLTPAQRDVCDALLIEAYVAEPLLRQGRLAGILCVHHHAPRAWTEAELMLIRETAERLWDAGERTRAEAALRLSEERLGCIFAAAPVGLSELSLDGRFLRVNGALCRMLGRSEGEMLRLTVPDVTRAEDIAPSFAAVTRVLETGQTATLDKRYIRPDGTEVWANSSITRLHDRQGSPGNLIVVTVDLSERKAAEAALLASEAMLRGLIEGMPQLVWRAAPGGAWSWASPQWAAYTGQAAEASRDAGWLEALHPADRAEARRAWVEAEANGLVEFDCRIRHAGSGHYAWFQARGVPVRDAAGRISAWIGTCTDIADKVRAREVVERGREELERVVEARTRELLTAEEGLRHAQKLESVGRLTGGIAHDFNNMLQGVTGAMEMARRRLAAGRVNDVARYVDVAREAADRAAGLTRRLLAFARRQSLDPQPLDHTELVANMAEMIRRIVGPEVALELRLADGGGGVLCDAGEFESAVLNLCINARDAMPAGGRLLLSTGEVELEPAEDGPPAGRYAEIAVEDTGTGMTPEVLARIFEPFFTTKPQGQGTGLGLSQVHGFARQAGGTVRIESGPGRGTVVRLLLPAHDAPAAAAAPDAPGPAAWTAAGGVVLLVDDEPTVRGPAADRLRDMGCQVYEAPDAAAALRMLEDPAAPRPGLLIADLGLPGGMSGLQMAEAARARVPGLRVLCITGKAEAPRAEGVAVMTKPFDLEALARRVEEMLAGQG